MSVPSSSPRVVICTALLAASLSVSRPADARPFADPARPIKAVVVGGSISMYYAGNYGQFLEHGCKHLEVVNKAKVGAGGRALVKRFRRNILGDRALKQGLTSGSEGWVIFQGGLNSVFAPHSTNKHLAALFSAAHDAGLKVMALTLTPWGDEKDDRFKGFEGVKTVENTKKINQFLLGKASVRQALGKLADKRTEAWASGELADIGVDVFHSPLRDHKAALRPAAPLERSFGHSRYRKKPERKAKVIEAARAVPRSFMKSTYRSFDHIHPNAEGHRVMAVRACRKAPRSWGCDCKRIARAVFKGKVRDP
jgi:hypothetical protein